MTLLRDVFGQFCVFGSGKSGPDNEMDGVKFGKLCRDCKLLDSRFTAADADLIHSKARAAGARRLDFTAFKEVALPLIAAKKGCSTKEVIERIKQAGGPIMACTVPEAVKLYDDRTMHTGIAAWKVQQEPLSPTSPKSISPRKVRSMRRSIPRSEQHGTPNAQASSPKSGGRGSPKSARRASIDSPEVSGAAVSTAPLYTPRRQVSFTCGELEGEAKGSNGESPIQLPPPSLAESICVVPTKEAASPTSLGPGDGTHQGLAIEGHGRSFFRDAGKPAGLTTLPEASPPSSRFDRPLPVQPLPLSAHPEEDGVDWLSQRRDLEAKLRTAQVLLGLYQAQCAQLCTCLATAGMAVPWHAVRWSREEVEGYFSHVAGIEMTEAHWKQWVQLLPSPLKPVQQ